MTNKEKELELFIKMSEDNTIPIVEMIRLNWIIQLAQIKLTRLCNNLR